jgi:hypothetical protein
MKKTRNRKGETATAYHEAGHAVTAYFLRLSMGRDGATIVPDHKDRTLGSAHILLDLEQNPEYSNSPGVRARIEDHAVMCMAGDAAERKFNPKRKFGGWGDIQTASAMASYVSSSAEVIQARLHLAKMRAKDIVDCRWDFIEVLAATLMENKTLKPGEVKQVFSSTSALARW